jgi:two-component system sensor histidine kinase YesM
MKSFSSDMTPILTLSKWCSENDLIAKYISVDTKDYKKASLEAWERLREEFNNNRSYSFINRVIIGDFKSNYIQMTRINSYFSVDIYDTITSFNYFDTLYKSPTVSWIGLKPDPFSDNPNEMSIPIIRPIYGLYNSDKIGWSYISVSTKLLTDAIDNYVIPKDSDLYLTINDKNYQLVDGTFYEITPEYTISSQKKTNGAIVQEVKDYKGRKSTIVSVGSSLNGWHLSQSLSNSEFAKQNKYYIIIMLLVAITVLSLSISLGLLLNRLINSPLKKINNKIKLIAQGDFSTDTSIEWNNEIGMIGKGINTLSKDIVNLIDMRIANEKEKQELEYQMLQSQINPHFLYNTLNSIKWMATIQKADGIAEMTTALSRLMKSVSKNTNQIVTLREEISLLDNYFVIQQYRYGGTITLEYMVEEERLYDCGVLKFTLQPLVENAIFHGIEPKGAVGKISIRIYLISDEKVGIEITDNGIGMTEAQLQSLLDGSSDTGSNFFKKIGVQNVGQRIHYTFGEEYGLTFTSKVGEYTRASIEIPYIIMEKDLDIPMQ